MPGWPSLAIEGECGNKGRKLDFIPNLGDKGQHMGELIELTLFQEAKRLLKAQLETEGLDSFLSRSGKQWFQIAPEKIEALLACAAAQAASTPSPKTLELARKEVRRELIRRVACAMVQTGF